MLETPVFDRVNADKDGSEGALQHAEPTFAIRKAILDADRTLRRKYDWLKHQSTIALALWLTSIATIAANVWALYHFWGVYPLWVAVPVSAFAASILHELEHDLIHYLYFNSPGETWMQDVMFFGIWVSKLSLNPWTRRTLHLLHHKRSGQPDDVEERLIGLGIPNVLIRILIAICPMAIAAYAGSIRRSNPSWRLLRGSACSRGRWVQRVDNAFISAPLWLPAAAWATRHPLLLAAAWGWAVPGALRHACIALMSSYSHYYGDIPVRDITFQNQILNHWAVLPFNAFCCNFGAEHIIHHYVVGQPFYLRHAVRHDAWKALIAHGARVNDFGVLWRANRWGEYNPEKEAAAAAAAAAAPSADEAVTKKTD